MRQAGSREENREGRHPLFCLPSRLPSLYYFRVQLRLCSRPGPRHSSESPLDWEELYGSRAESGSSEAMTPGGLPAAPIRLPVRLRVLDPCHSGSGESKGQSRIRVRGRQDARARQYYY